jgi:hypothetical protein
MYLKILVDAINFKLEKLLYERQHRAMAGDV